MTPTIITRQTEIVHNLSRRMREPQLEISAAEKLEALTILARALLRVIEEVRQKPDSAAGINISEEVHRFEAELIRSALVQTGGRLRRTARLLGMKVTTLHNKIKRYRLQGIVPKEQVR